LEIDLPTVLGIVKCSFQELNGKQRINVTYNCEILKGRELGDMM